AVAEMRGRNELTRFAELAGWVAWTAEKRVVEKDGRAKEGRAKVAAGRKAVIRAAGARKDPRPRAASVDTRQVLLSAASAVIARTEVRVILVVSDKKQ